MSDSTSAYTTRLSLVVALGGFLMGFDSAVISGVVDPVRGEFGLSADELGWVVACLTLGSTLAMGIAGPIADRFGRRPVLAWTAFLFTLSAIGSALADTSSTLVLARIVGGFGVGGALIIAPIYIAEIAPPERRGQLVSFNQLNIVLGFSAAFFSNYFLNDAGMSWRWMLGVEAIPAAVYLLLLVTLVPRSPRWLAARGREDEALATLTRTSGADNARAQLDDIRKSLAGEAEAGRVRLRELFNRRMTRVLVIGLGLGFFQQITGINAIFYYSTTIFGLAGAARDVALGHAILVGLVNVAFTLLAMRLIDRLGRRPLLMIGTSLMAVALLTNSAAFSAATYELDAGDVASFSESIPASGIAALTTLTDESFEDQAAFVAAVEQRAANIEDAPAKDAVLGKIEDLSKAALEINGLLVLGAIMLYIAAFAISLGPVMWAMFSEIFPQRVRGIAVSVAGFFNSFVSFSVQQLFPRGLETLGPEGVFLVFGVFAALAFFFTLRFVPETKGRSLEELEAELVRSN